MNTKPVQTKQDQEERQMTQALRYSHLSFVLSSFAPFSNANRAHTESTSYGLKKPFLAGASAKGPVTRAAGNHSVGESNVQSLLGRHRAPREDKVECARQPNQGGQPHRAAIDQGNSCEPNVTILHCQLTQESTVADDIYGKKGGSVCIRE